MSTSKGTVKAVLSGDTVIVMGAPVGGPPPERQITLAGIISPKLGRRDGATKDEPFAWAAREFLRKFCVGKVVTFEVEEVVASIGKSFGHLIVDGQNASFALVSAGLAKVKSVQGNNPARTQYHEELSQLEQQAQAAGLGVWTKEANAGANSVRNIITEFDAKQVLEDLKGTPREFIVEQFRDGATCRGYLLPSFHWITVFFSGVSCPGFKRSEDADGTEIPEPFALEARYFCESRLLNRDVKVLLEGVDKYNNFYGSLIHPAGDIGSALLKVGLGKVVDWSAKFSRDPAELYKSERIAKEQRLRIWKDYQAPTRSATAAGATEFVGKVIEVISGDFLVVRDMAVPPVEHKIALSSIKAPKLARRAEEKEEPYAWEAREFLRTRLIGHRVTVGIDYIRPLPNAAPGQETERVCGSVLEGQNNVAVALVANGLATVMKHRQDDQDRSLYYDDLIQAEAAAARDKKGLHGNAPPPRRHINDISQSSALSQAKQMFSFLQRAGRMQGVVQHVVNGARFKVLCPRESCVISLAIAGIKCPMTARKEGEAGEKYGEDALQFSRAMCLQHDVEVEVLAQDKIGTMIGRIYVQRRDVGVALLAEGLARLTGRDATGEMEEAQATAQIKRLRTWERWDEEMEAVRAAEQAMELVELAGAETTEVTVTEMVDAVTFQAQSAGAEQQLKYIGDRIAAANLPATPGAPQADSVRPKIGDVCVAQFSEDQTWYRARIEGRTGDLYSVLFVDYGNGEKVPASRIRALPAGVPPVSQIPAQSTEFRLAYLKAPREEELAREAAALVEEVLAENHGQVGCKLEFKERSGRVHATLYSKVTGESISSMLLRAGLAKIERRAGRAGGADPAAGLRVDQEAARRARLGIWRYGDAVDSDEEDNRFAQDVAAAKAKNVKK